MIVSTPGVLFPSILNMTYAPSYSALIISDVAAFMLTMFFSLAVILELYLTDLSRNGCRKFVRVMCEPCACAKESTALCDCDDYEVHVTCSDKTQDDEEDEDDEKKDTEVTKEKIEEKTEEQQEESKDSQETEEAAAPAAYDEEEEVCEDPKLMRALRIKPKFRN
jgi:hypothetical protein